MFNDVAWVVGFARLLRLKEELQRACGAVFGHRFLRGVCTPGGVLRDLDDAQQLWLRRVLGDVRAEVEDVLRIARANASVVDRFTACGTLSPENGASAGHHRRGRARERRVARRAGATPTRSTASSTSRWSRAPRAT